MSNRLFDEFPPIGEKQWKQKIQVDLRGADYNDTLITKTLEGISILPFYHQDTFKALNISQESKEFLIGQTIYISHAQAANKLAKDALEKGAETIIFIADKPFDVDLTLNGLITNQDNTLKVYFELHFLDTQFISELSKKTEGLDTDIHTDIIGHLAQSGNWYHDHQKDHEVFEYLLSHHRNINFLSVNTKLYQNAGANIIQQIAYALAHAFEYLNFIINKGNQKYIQKATVKFAIGSNYFFEIAKIRTFKYLWKMLCKEFDLNIALDILAEPSRRNMCIYDYNNNMLRTLSACQSAILGGAQVVCNLAYDSIYHRSNDFGERIARNQLNILKHESNIKDDTFTKGSYYIEQISLEMAEKSLKIFKDIEKSGGFVKQLFAGSIQRKIKESASKEQHDFSSDKLQLLGVNLQPNAKDRMKNDLELFPFQKKNSRKTIIEPIIEKRIAEDLEKKRLAQE